MYYFWQHNFAHKIQIEIIFFITLDIMTKIIYYIIEMAYDELQYEKYQYLERTLKRIIDIIKSASNNKRDELKRLRIKCQTDNDSPYFDSLMHITTTVVTEAIKLLYYTTRAELSKCWQNVLGCSEFLDAADPLNDITGVKICELRTVF